MNRAGPGHQPLEILVIAFGIVLPEPERVVVARLERCLQFRQFRRQRRRVSDRGNELKNRGLVEHPGQQQRDRQIARAAPIEAEQVAFGIARLAEDFPQPGARRCLGQRRDADQLIVPLPKRQRLRRTRQLRPLLGLQEDNAKNIAAKHTPTVILNHLECIQTF